MRTFLAFLVVFSGLFLVAGLFEPDLLLGIPIFMLLLVILLCSIPTSSRQKTADLGRVKPSQPPFHRGAKVPANPFSARSTSPAAWKLKLREPAHSGQMQNIVPRPVTD